MPLEQPMWVDPKGEVTVVWHGREGVREPYAYHDSELTLEWVYQLCDDMRYRDCPPKVRQLGRTMGKWRTQIAAWPQSQVSNGPTETAQRPRQAHQARGVRPAELRPLAHRRAALASTPDWSNLPTVTP